MDSIILEIWERHENLMESIPPIARETWKQSALSEPNTAEKDRYYLLDKVIQLESLIEYLRLEKKRP
jgi:hypothetical protein